MTIKTASLSVDDPAVNLGVALEVDRNKNTATARVFWPAERLDITDDLSKIEGLTRFGRHGSSTQQRSMVLGPVMFGHIEERMTVNLAFAEVKKILGETKLWDPLTTVSIFLEKGEGKLTVSFTAGELNAMEVGCDSTFRDRDLRLACVLKLKERFKEVSYNNETDRIVVLLKQAPRKSTEAIAAAMTVAQTLNGLKDDLFDVK